MDRFLFRHPSHKYSGEAIAIPTIEAALVARNISALKDQRLAASNEIKEPPTASYEGNKPEFVSAVRDALYASKICSYAQGLNLIRAGSEEWKWGINLSEVARIWQGGCIIRAKFLGRIKEEYQRRADLPNLLLDAEFKNRLEQGQINWREVVSTAAPRGVPTLAISASLGYFDMYRIASLPLNLTQAQRDFFGSHTYERIDKPDQGFIHTDWEGLLAKQQNSWRKGHHRLCTDLDLASSGARSNG